jgi:bacillithiol biosynthesis deacetylase BshB1
MNTSNNDFYELLKTIPALDVLVFAPHPDDAELFCGGTIACLVKSGYQVGIIDFTLGEASSKGTPEIRAVETKKATEILKLHFRGTLGIPDTTLYKEGSISIAEQIRRTTLVIRATRPQIILAPYGENRHPDHQGGRMIAQEAGFMSGVKTQFPELPPYTTPLTMFYMCRKAFSPSIVVDITTVLDVKKKAIESYTSQITNKDGSSPTLISHPLSISSIESRDAYYGSMIGVSSGEPFYIDGPLPMQDPVKFIRSQKPFPRFITP